RRIVSRSRSPKASLCGLQLMKQCRQVRLQRVPATWNHSSSRGASGRTGAGASRIGSGIGMAADVSFRRRARTPVQVEVGPAGDQREDVADLLEAGAQEEVRVPAVALGPEDVEVRLRVAEGGR